MRIEDKINKLSRNDPCHCGSGKKYKKCHLGEDAKAASAKLEAHNAAVTAAAEAAAAAEEDAEDGAPKKAVAAPGKTARATHGSKHLGSEPTARKVRRRGIA